MHQAKNCKKRMSDTGLQTKSKSKMHRFKSNTLEYYTELNNRQLLVVSHFNLCLLLPKKELSEFVNLRVLIKLPKI